MLKILGIIAVLYIIWVWFVKPLFDAPKTPKDKYPGNTPKGAKGSQDRSGGQYVDYEDVE